jgi:hypothetical protein
MTLLLIMQKTDANETFPLTKKRGLNEFVGTNAFAHSSIHNRLIEFQEFLFE